MAPDRTIHLRARASGSLAVVPSRKRNAGKRLATAPEKILRGSPAKAGGSAISLRTATCGTRSAAG
jgi:hypothetical protein